MKIFLTGSSGFIGANMVRHLLDSNHELHVVLRDTELTPWRLSGIENQLNIWQGDITSKSSIEYILNEVRPEAIIHMATYGAYPTKQADFDSTIQTCYIGLANILSSYNRYGIMINTGSSSEYGICGKPMSEYDLPHPADYYGAAKAAATILCQTQTRLKASPIITTRLFSTYGPYEDRGRLFPYAIAGCLAGKPMSFTSGRQIRDFIHVDDVCSCYSELLERPDLAGQIINVGTGHPSSVKSAISKIFKYTGNLSQPSFGSKPHRDNEAMHWLADMSNAHKHLAWRSSHTLDSGIVKTVEWFKDNLEHYEEIVL